MLDKLKINKKLLKQLDFSIIIILVLIVLFGSINIYSAVSRNPAFNYNGFKLMKLQLSWLVLSLIVVYVILLIDYVVIVNYAAVFYWMGVGLLLLNSVIGTTVNGANGWIKLGSRAIQPSEFAKIGMILLLAKKIEDMEGDINNFKNFIQIVIYAAIPMVLVLVQPDMGMAMVSFFIVLGIVFIAGLDSKVIIGGLASIFVLIVAVWNSPLMKLYWKVRLTTFLDPEKYELGAGLQLVQSKIGIGSGGIFGTGFLKGIQVASVPENQTDYIFSVVGEEWGLIGAIVLLLMYGLVLYKLIKIAKSSKDISGKIISIGLVSNLMFAILQNIGMTIGIMPTTGITLPFMSYGGSSLLTNFIAVGIVLNIGMRRKKINF